MLKRKGISSPNTNGGKNDHYRYGVQIIQYYTTQYKTKKMAIIGNILVCFIFYTLVNIVI